MRRTTTQADPMREHSEADHGYDHYDDSLGVFEVLTLLRENSWTLIIAPLLVGLLALALTYAINPTFTARTTFLPPQQQNTNVAALASLGALASIAGASTGLKNPAEQYVALMQSTTVEDRLVDRFKLMEVYKAKYRTEARKELEKNVRIAVGRKDGLISVEVDDIDPKRAADIANAHIDELKDLASGLALSEAQQRRVFFEGQLTQTRQRLVEAQQGLEASGYNADALKAEPKATAESYAALRAEATAAEVRLQTLRRGLADGTPEVQKQQTLLAALRAQLARIAQSSGSRTGPDYIGRYREFKYQETLFDLLARQYEMARVDEAREGALIQVIDPATPPELKSRPKRAVIAIIATLVALAVTGAIIVARNSRRRMSSTLGSVNEPESTNPAPYRA